MVIRRDEIGNLITRNIANKAKSLDGFSQKRLKKSKLGKNFPRISIHTHKKSDRHNFCINENFVKKNTEKNTISLKSSNLQSYLKTKKTVGGRSF